MQYLLARDRRIIPVTMLAARQGNLPVKIPRIAGKPVPPDYTTAWGESPGAMVRKVVSRGNQQPSAYSLTATAKVHRSCTGSPTGAKR